MRYSKSRNAGTGHLNLTLGTRHIIWIFLFHFSFVSSASWLVLEGVMSARCQAAIALLRIVFSCDGWLRCAVLISHIRIIHLHEFFFISWAGSRAKDDCYMGHTHRLLQDKLKLIVCSMFTVPNVFGAWQWWRVMMWPPPTTPPHDLCHRRQWQPHPTTCDDNDDETMGTTMMTRGMTVWRWWWRRRQWGIPQSTYNVLLLSWFNKFICLHLSA